MIEEIVGKVYAEEDEPGPHFEAPCTDLANAQRLVHRFGHLMRYCQRLGGWFVYDGKRYVEDTTGQVERWGKMVARSLHDEARDQTDDKARLELAKWAARSQNAAKLTAMEQVARTEAKVVARPEDFDADDMLFAVENGIIDLRTGKLLPHGPEHLTTKLSPASFDPAAQGLRWQAFVEEVLPDPDVRDYLQRALGLAMMGRVLEHVLLVLIGVGANGKSVLLEVVRHVFGDYGHVAEPALLLVNRNDQHPTGRAALRGARFVTTSEPDAGKRLNEGEVKALTGGEVITARRMREDFFEIRPTWTIAMATNHKPEIRGTDDGIWRRVKLIPFDVKIAPEDQDPELAEKLKGEADGILNWLLEGLAAYRRNGLDEPVAVKAATGDYRAESNPLELFLEERTETGPHFSADTTKLYQAWADWCDASGLSRSSKIMFGRMMTEAGFERSRTTSDRFYVGLRLLQDDEQSTVRPWPRPVA